MSSGDVSDSSKSFNYDELCSLVGGSTQLADSLLAKFEVYAGSQWNAIRDRSADASGPDGFGMVKREIHSLKGSSSYVFAENLTELCRVTLTEMDGECSAAHLHRRIGQIGQEVEIVRADIRRRLQDDPRAKS